MPPTARARGRRRAPRARRGPSGDARNHPRRPPARRRRGAGARGALPHVRAYSLGTVICGCIDIGSNTTRLLVTEPADGRLRELLRQRAFTRIGKGLLPDDTIPAKKIKEVAEVVATQVRLARELGTETIRAVATAAIREAANQDDFTRAIAERTGVEVEVLSDEEEARLAFVGATSALDHPPDGDIAVVDVGGSSSEIAIGTIAEGVRMSSSFRIGSGFLADAYLHDDPPSVAQ